MANLAAGFAQDTGLYDLFLKEWYINKWADLLNNLTTTYRFIRKRTVSFKGRRMVIPLRINRTGAVGAIQVSGYIQPGGSSVTSYGGSTTITPGYQGVTNALVRPAIIMGAIGVPQDTMDVSSSDRGAFYEAVDFEMMNMKTDMSNFLDKMMYLGGSPLADITAVSTVTLTVSNTHPFFVNQRLRFARADANNYGVERGTGPYYVSSIDRANSQVVLTADPGAVATDRPYTDGARSYTATGASVDEGVNFEWFGLEDTIGSGNMDLNNYEGSHLYEGIDATTNPTWQSQVVSSVGDITFDDLHTICDDIHDNSGGEPTLMLTSRPVRRQIARRMAYTFNVAGTEVVGGTQRFMNTTRLKGGYIGRREDQHGTSGSDWMMFDDNLPIVVDRYAPNVSAGTTTGSLYVLDTRHWYVGLVTDWKWWAPEGRILREASGDAFGVQAHAYIFGQLICDARNTAGRLDGINT